jgi:hypothetical protein
MQAMSRRGSRSDAGGAEVFRCGSDQNLMVGNASRTLDARIFSGLGG